MKLEYKKTLNNSINRKVKLIDDKLQFYKNIPLFNWIEISPIDACNRSVFFVQNQILIWLQIHSKLWIIKL